jgi:hypothetical protein
MAKEKPVPEMCAGCARNKKTYCGEVIKAPGWLYEHHPRGICFAWINEARAKEIEAEIKFIQKGAKA